MVLTEGFAEGSTVKRMPVVLVVDDDETVRQVVGEYGVAAGMEVHCAATGPDGLAQATALQPDLIILDLMLPGIDGHEVFRRLRSSGLTTPVIMLTAKGNESDRILGLEIGADDYVAKPFSPRELVLRARSVLRRQHVGPGDATPEQPAPEPAREVVVDGNLTVDLTARRAILGGRTLNLTMREFDLLAYLVTHPDTVISRTGLMGAVWGWDYGDQSTVTVHVRRLRGKIEADPAAPTRLVTVWGRGYRWDLAQ